jgi:hypothetical protein
MLLANAKGSTNLVKEIIDRFNGMDENNRVKEWMAGTYVD